MIKDKFLETIREYGMLERGDRVVLGVSGGADSTALLYLLDSCREELGISLHVAHLNHMLRRGEAELDVRYVQGLTQNLKLPVTVETMEVAVFAGANKMGLEAAARKLRYGFFEKVAGQVDANKIAVGHSADDNIETFLMRLLRGSGIKGLCGIPPKRGKIIRPLIKIWRKEIEDYVGALKLVPRRDHTNYESKFMRNRVRLKLIPQLKVYNLNIKEIILQTILLLTDDSSYLDAKSEEALAKIIISSKEEELQLDIDKLQKLDYAIQGHVVRSAIEMVKGDLMELSFVHVHDILDNLGKSEKWELHLPSGVFAVGNRDKLIITREKPRAREKRSYRYLLPVPGEIEIKEIGKKLRASVVEKQAAATDPRSAFLDYSAIGKEVIVRSRLDGDRFYPLGMRGTKKVQDLFIDEKIPVEERDSVPIVESGGKILWVGGVRLDERAKVARDTKKVVKLELM